MDYNSTTPTLFVPSFLGIHPKLPPHCHPSNEFLHKFSAYTHACVPIPLAFASTFVGMCSITAWLFAQLPQIVKNFQLSSASGLSMFFLVEWLAGDASNFLGALLTGQATWQKIIGFYYCIADIMLLVQYLWYEHLRHGRPMKVLWVKRYMDGHIEPDMNPTITSTDIAHTPRPLHEHRANSLEAVPRRNESTRKIFRRGKSFPFSPATPPTKVVITISLLLAVLSRASPLPFSTSLLSDHHGTIAATRATDGLAYTIGTVLSWCSTLLYLISRIPQLVKNQRRQSTAGLSINMFVAAFLGNLFYSSSLLLNPCAWNSYGPYGGGGWVSGSGSSREQWVAAAAPFFLGAAGVLTMDACVFIQFLYFGDGAIKIEEPPRHADAIAGGIPDDQLTRSRERVLVVESEDFFGQRRWEQVKGWMRGWRPSYSAANSVAGTERTASPTKGDHGNRPRAISKTASSRSRSQPRTPLSFRSPVGSVPNHTPTSFAERLSGRFANNQLNQSQKQSESASQADTEVSPITASNSSSAEEDERQPLLLPTRSSSVQQQRAALPSYRVLDRTGSVYHDDSFDESGHVAAAAATAERSYGTVSGSSPPKHLR